MKKSPLKLYHVIAEFGNAHTVDGAWAGEFVTCARSNKEVTEHASEVLGGKYMLNIRCIGKAARGVYEGPVCGDYSDIANSRSHRKSIDKVKYPQVS